ncbi:alanine/glycine:cation symporter family protein [Tenacibaculum maritimum]|uniref:alanine/glycine:cation symporter family protein n=1 Tax=Tenacibaculum maritimum TaxID=107401 RepID=UPI001E3CBCBB|nr:alanine/glycine:cation symporter family protein [Tenacibaculum maritimum]MCD9562881.1 alanine:cation symporter family protein [Tenacibaculum maritimum]MCD9564582.1 alanine:cation symporter family protein [Tenacibaculum maritimum]MCD9578311.1 alanine:cation symporter family protein [Tenacibaculum maritimum]MCD9595462.1 alanine:cation symporter family protein [Tenacibaculum maritimum]MCD9612676.1 alanine:cation symporter family protein [Tenacibaculum maritimum]
MFLTVQKFIAEFSSWIWGIPLLFLLIGGGVYLFVYSGLVPFRYFGHAVAVLRGKYDKHDAPGDLSHYEALSSAIAATVGMGNISGVAIAIATGGPGAIFWMWISAFVGMATKFFTCSLAVMYRGKDEEGNVKGGPMYVITEGLGKKWKPLALFFASAGLIGTLPAFQANQLTQTLIDVFKVNEANEFIAKLLLGIVIAIIVSMVIFGGIKRIGKVAGKLVPIMVVIYLLTVITILVLRISEVPAIFTLIFTSAFTGKSVVGGALGTLIITGVKRAAFSNEAGLGTAPMMHGTAKTKEPIREGLVAMLGPAIDTLLVCTLTALAILASGVWKGFKGNGISMTLAAFDSVLPYHSGSIILTICVLIFAFSTLFTYSFYGYSCLSYLTTIKVGKYYNYIYVGTVIIASIIKLDFVINLIDSAYALMAIPTVISTLILAPKVKKAATIYFQKLKSGAF